MAATKLLKFVERTQAYPAKRSADERAHDFLEISRPYILAKAEEQAGRCSQCGVPFCQVHCPLQNNIPDWLKLTAEGRLQEAYEVSAATNAMPEICGRICPQDRLCEGNCVIEPGFGSVTIGSVEKFLTDNAWEQGWVKPLQPVADRSGQSVAIIGAGPAGLTAAEALRVKGYDVHVFDRHDRAGGLLTYGIPGFKLEKPVVMRRVERLREGGVHFHQDFAVGRDASLADLRAKHAAVLIATGVYKARQVEVPGADGPTTMEALDYLIAANKTGFGDALPDAATFDATGKHVVVIGGGDTGSDCIGTSFRQGAKSVTQLEILARPPDRENKEMVWPEWPLKFRTSSSQEEGAERGFSVATEKFSGKDGKVTTLHCVKLDAKMQRIAGSEFAVPADLVLLAMGFVHPVHEGMVTELGVAKDKRGNVEANTDAYRTSLDKVFAAGDMRRGQSLVVWAIREGRQAARSIDEFLMGSTTLPR